MQDFADSPPHLLYPSSVQSSPSPPVMIKTSLGCPTLFTLCGVDKKTKKMEQNKTAANRYRQKKKAGQELISAECRELEQKNDSLNEKVDSIAKEIQYLKNLMEVVRKAKSKQAKRS
ncbi:cyclic AMP-dependent transcription factor ATF-4-like [Rana temporaria]|uniref:cyclic AMP-dependent transcription factor ATF-4-like n=1 Tax=Rana temporaria TaxID=8407 RepID=UPI001AAC8AE6|nr:cyclic AMP-dependent transcription factor ATF-4-like [Rana temporaria]